MPPEKVKTTDQQAIVPPRHLGYLDAARGIAASMVLFYHYVGWRYPERTIIKLSFLVFNGSDAVSFFFVLSGLVLSYKYLVKGDALDIRKFWINRYFRLFPAFFLTILINALYWQRHELGLGALVDTFIKNKSEFWEEAILLREHPHYFIPSWTLAVELAISFFIPFLVLLAQKNRKLLIYFIVAILFVARVTNQFFIHFTLGMLICCYFQEINSDQFKETRWYRFRYLWLIIAFILFSVRHLEALSPFGPTYKYLSGYFQIDFFFWTGLGSFMILVWLVQGKRIQRVLSHSIFRYIGKVSYGIYLMHWTVVKGIYDHWDYFMGHFSNAKTGFIVMMIVCFLLTLLLATILHYTVELPFIRIGKRFTDKLRPSVMIG